MRKMVYAGLFAMWPVVVLAQTRAPAPAAANTGQASQGKMQASDAAFVGKAAESGLAEVQMGQLAATKAQSPEVKEFGQRMVKDHTAANQQLLSIAEGKGVTPPKALDAKDAQALQKLKSESDSQFDHDYIQNQVAAHRQAVTLFEREAKESKDPALKQFAERTLPTLQEHLRLAEGLQKR